MSMPMTVAMAMKMYLLASLTWVNRMQYSCDMIFRVQKDTYFLRSFDNSNLQRGLNPELMSSYPDSKIHGVNTGPTWLLSASGGPLVGPWTLLSMYAGEFPAQRPVIPRFGCSLICARINDWVNNREAEDFETPLRSLWRHCFDIDKVWWSRWWQNRGPGEPLSRLKYHLLVVGYNRRNACCMTCGINLSTSNLLSEVLDWEYKDNIS